MKAWSLKRVISAVRLAAARNDARPPCQRGALIRALPGGKVLIVATDGHRMHLAEFPRGWTSVGSDRWLAPDVPAENALDPANLQEPPSPFPPFEAVIPVDRGCGFRGWSALQWAVDAVIRRCRLALRTPLEDVEGETSIDGYPVRGALRVGVDRYVVRYGLQWLRVDRRIPVPGEGPSDRKWWVSKRKTREVAAGGLRPGIEFARGADGTWTYGADGTWTYGADQLSQERLEVRDRGAKFPRDRATGDEQRVSLDAGYLRDALRGCPDRTVDVSIGSPLDPVEVRSGGFRAVITPRRL